MEKPPVKHPEKEKLRAKMRSLTQSLDWEKISIDVLENLRNHIHSSKKEILGAYWPLKSEVNSLPFLEEWCAYGGTVGLPSIEKDQSPLAFYLWTPQSEMKIGKYNIPILGKLENRIFPDILLIPLLAFDENGYRLGRGGGFYDLTLAELRLQKKIYAVGLGSEHQFVPDVFHEKHDERLDCVMTDKQVYVFSCQ